MVARLGWNLVIYRKVVARKEMRRSVSGCEQTKVEHIMELVT